jgi:hypothetical protein
MLRQPGHDGEDHRHPFRWGPTADLLPRLRCCCRRRCSRPTAAADSSNSGLSPTAAADSNKVLRRWLAVYVSLTKLTILTSTLLMGSFGCWMIAPNDLAGFMALFYYGILWWRTKRSKTELVDSAITAILRGTRTRTRTRTKGNTGSCGSNHDLIKVA